VAKFLSGCSFSIQAALISEQLSSKGDLLFGIFFESHLFFLNLILKSFKVNFLDFATKSPILSANLLSGIFVGFIRILEI